MKVRDIFFIENPLIWFCTVLLVVVFVFSFYPASPYNVELHCLRPDKQEAFGWTSWADGGSTPASGGQSDDDDE